MNEYISRDDVRSMVLKYRADNPKKQTVWAMVISDMLRDLKEIPAADVQPVVHAYWIELPKALNPNENPCKCSNCGHVLSFMNYYPKSKYCDDCGARMDLKDGGAE